MGYSVKNLCLLLLCAFVVAGCRQKEKEQGISNKVVQPEEMQITGQIFIVTKEAKNVVLGDVEVALFDQRQMWTCMNSNALQWSNSLAEAQAKVDQATTNYDALYKDDIDKFTAAKKYHDKIVEAVSTVKPEEWDQAYAWSKKLEKEINNLVELKNSSDVGKKLHDAVWERAYLWDTINWPSIINLLTSGCDTPNRQITTTDSEGHFKFVVPASSPNLVLFAKAERQAGDEKEKYLWLYPVGTPAGNEGTNNLWELKMVAESRNGIFWFPKAELKGKTTEVILSNDNKSDFGVWNYLENTNIANYMLNYGVEVDVAKRNR
jgi:hypothetical protein